jgi:hypothetical protein
MSAISYEELGALSGELLPERAVLGVVTPMGGSDGGATVTGVCSLNQAGATTGLGALLGLGAPATQLSNCVPAITTW